MPLAHWMIRFSWSLAISLFVGTACAATSYGTNLITNPGGESSGTSTVAMSSYGWTGTGVTNYYVYYDATNAHTGNSLLGYYNNPLYSGTISKDCYQDFDISSIATDIDANIVLVSFSGWLRRAATSGSVSVSIQQFNASGTATSTQLSTSNATNTWTQASFVEAVSSGTRKLRVSLAGTNIYQGYAAFDDLSLLVAKNTEAAPTITTIANQLNVSGDTSGALAFTIGDADNAVSSLQVSATSSNQTLIPNARITLAGSGASRTLTFSSVAGQTGTDTITIAVSDGVKTTRMSFVVTVAPAYQLGANLVVNGTGASVSGWNGETSRFLLGTVFQVGTLTSGQTKTIIYQDINVAKFTALIDQGWQNYTSSCTVTSSGECSLEGLDQYGNVLWTKTGTSLSGVLATGTRVVRVKMGGPVGATIDNITFTLTSTGYPRISAIAEQSVISGFSVGPIAFVVGYAGNGVLSASSSNTALIPNANVSFAGSGYSRTLTIASLAGTNGSATITLSVDGTSVGSFLVNVKGVPGAPTNVVATPGDASATVSFTAPASTGGSAITAYVVTSSPGNVLASGGSSPITISGLVNGTTYTFKVQAINAVDTGAYSDASNAVTPYATPIAGDTNLVVAYNSTNNTMVLPLSGGPVTQIDIITDSQHGTAVASGSVILYTPTTGYAGPDTIVYQAKNSATSSNTAHLFISVSAPVLSLTPATLSDSISRGKSYSQSFVADGGTGPYSYLVASGTLPTGLSLDSNGNLSGTPTQLGSYSFHISATDKSTGANAPFSIEHLYTLQVTNNAPVLLSVTNQSAAFTAVVPLDMGDVVASDENGDSLFLVLDTGASYELNGTTVVPWEGFSGTLYVPVRVCDGVDTSAAMTMEILVDAITPVAARDSRQFSIRNSSQGFAVDMPAAGSMQLAIYDMSGRQVYSHQWQLGIGATNISSVPVLQSGTYLVRATSGSQVRTLRWVKQ